MRNSLKVQPNEYLGDVTGRPLDYGMVWFGQPNKDPEFYPIDIFYDAELTLPAAQPVRTKGGYLNGNGDIVEIYAAQNEYSVKVLDSYGRKVFYRPKVTTISNAIGTIENNIKLPFFGAVDRTLIERSMDSVSVADFGAVGDGVTDDSQAFKNAYNAARTGQAILVPYTPVGYYLAANPDDGAKAITWDFEAGVKLQGPGVGNANTGNATFWTPYTNPWLRINGKHRKIDLGLLSSPAGGAIVGDTWEYYADQLNDLKVSFTATVTNGSSVLTNVNADFSKLNIAARLTASLSGWGDDVRIISFDAAKKTITCGINTGNGTAVPTNFTGTTTENVPITAIKRQWFAGRYEGMNTGNKDADEVHYELANPVMNITGTKGIMYEFNLNTYANPTDWSTGIFMTGGGNVQAKITALDIQRDTGTEWINAISIRKANLGVAINARFPLKIETQYKNASDTFETIGYGIHFNNTPNDSVYGSLLEGAQLTNGSTAIKLFRNTDSGAWGRYIQCMDSKGQDELFFVPTDGSVITYAPANSNGSAVNAGSIQCNGITLRGGTNIRLGNNATAMTKSPSGKYLTVYDEAGTACYIPVYH